MLGRREFLAGAIGVGAVGSLAAQVALSPDARDSAASPLAHGARGDGKTDDLAALRRAFDFAIARGVPVDGGERVYALNGNLDVSGAIGPWIRALRLRQLDPANGRRTLFFDKCRAIRIESLRIDVGDRRSVGDMNSSAGLWIDGGSNHDIRNVEVFGHGKNSLIAIWSTTSSLYDGLIARDAEFDAPAAGDDLIQGIWLSRNVDCVLRNARAFNLTGNAAYAGRRFRNLRTRGISLGGNVRVSVINADVRNVEQGIDITGSEGNRLCTVIGGRSSDCGTVGVKLANSAVGCRVEDHVAERVGMYAFLASGPSEAGLPYKTQDCDFVRCVAIDTGSNRIEFADTSAFQVRAGDYDRELPSGIRFIGCSAIDRQAVKTMKYGYFSDVPQSRGRRPNQLIDCRSQGHARADRLGAWS